MRLQVFRLQQKCFKNLFRNISSTKVHIACILFQHCLMPAQY